MKKTLATMAAVTAVVSGMLTLAPAASAANAPIKIDTRHRFGSMGDCASFIRGHGQFSRCIYVSQNPNIDLDPGFYPIYS